MPIQHVHPIENGNMADNQVTDDDGTNTDYNTTDDDSTHAPPSSNCSSSATSSDDDDSDDDAPQPNLRPTTRSGRSTTTRSGRSSKRPPHLSEYHLYAQSIDESALQHIDEDTLATVCVHIMVQYVNKVSAKSVKPRTYSVSQVASNDLESAERLR